MDNLSVTTTVAPDVIIDQVSGNLQIKGWERPELLAKAEQNNLTLEEKDDVVKLSCKSNCTIYLPHAASIQIDSIGGNADFKLLEDQLSIQKAHGSIVLRNVASTQIGSVSGDFSAKSIAGDLQVKKIRGNASVKYVQGKCTLEHVDGNLSLRNTEGDIFAYTGGNTRIRLNVLLADNYQFQADGNIHCRIPEDADVKLDLSSKAEVIKVRFPGISETYRQASSELILGTGDAQMGISAGGTLYLVGQATSWEETEDQRFDFSEGAGMLPDDFSQQISQQVEAQIEAQMEAMTLQLNEHMAQLSQQISQSGMSPEQVEQILQQARETSERETARAQENLRRSQEKVGRKLEAAQRRHTLKAKAAERRARTHSRKSWGTDWSSMPSPQSAEPVTEEERSTILRMLEQKKISIDEAEQLLSALEGDNN
jgi:DUF4097 and DUF4098 domain-containing protein YvlB